MGLHIFRSMFEKIHLEQMTCVVYVWGPKPNFWAVNPSSENQKTRGAVVISFQVVSRRDGGSKARLALAGWLRLAGGYWLHKVVSLSAQIHFSCKKY